MPEIPQDTIDQLMPCYALHVNPELQGFISIRIVSVDETSPYKPPKTVEVTSSSGKFEIDANTVYAVFRDGNGGALNVSASAAGHIDRLHIKATEPGSQFDVDSIDELLGIVREHLPVDIAQVEGVSAFAVETGRAMGSEGVAGLDELLEKGLISTTDVDILAASKDIIIKLNLEGSLDDKASFVKQFNETHEDSMIKLQLVRGNVIVPSTDAPKQPTTKLFMVFGPGKNGKTMYTIAPGRYMPKMPNVSEHISSDGIINNSTFEESSKAWLNTVMLTGK